MNGHNDTIKQWIIKGDHDLGTAKITYYHIPEYLDTVLFISKTRLIEHYERTLGAVHVGNHKMVIFPKEALGLIKKYYKI